MATSDVVVVVPLFRNQKPTFKLCRDLYLCGSEIGRRQFLLWARDGPLFPEDLFREAYDMAGS